jgi:two-component system, OmpR family, KDP operon response regulator KdpE
MNTRRILVVTGESITRRDLRDFLVCQAYVVIDARSCDEALEEIEANRIDLALLDINPPELGFEMCVRIRQASDVPIILLLPAISTKNDKFRASETAGANDYLVRPFTSDQLIARMRAAFRLRPDEAVEPQFESSDLKIDFACRRVIVNNRFIHLTPKELELLRLLVLNQGKPVHHLKLLQALWGSASSHHIGHLRVFIKSLRKKIEPHSIGPRDSHIQTDNFIGYHFEPNPEKLANLGNRKDSVRPSKRDEFAKGQLAARRPH